MIPEYTERIALRLPIEERRRIEQLVRDGEYKTISQVIRTALREFLKESV